MRAERNFVLVMFCALTLFTSKGSGQVSWDSTSRWSIDFRYGYAAFAAPAATLPLANFEPGRYVELSFLPSGAPSYGIAYATTQDSSFLFLAGLSFQTMFTTLDVSDSSFHDFQQGEYAVASLRISQIRGTFEMRGYAVLPGNIGIGIWRAGLGLACVWASSVNVFNQAKTFPGIQGIAPHPSWLLAVGAGLGYRIPGSSLTLTADITANLTMEFVSNKDFLEITMTPSSPYKFEDSGVSPVYLSLGVIVDI